MKADFGGVGRGGPWLTVNVGNDLRPESDIVADITAKARQLGAHIDLGSLDAIRCIHTLEHLPSDQIIPTLAYWRQFLKPGGELVIVVPNAGLLAIDYADGLIPLDVLAAVMYVPGSRVGDRPEEQHRWAFDAETLRAALCKAGYKDVEPAGDEAWPAFWIFDMDELAYTGQIGRYEVPNLRFRGIA
jgi:predicted SAM-dependent methyltransferase